MANFTESDSESEKKDKEKQEAFEMQVNKIMVGLQGIIFIIQITTFSLYLYRSSKVPEIQCLTKVMALLTTISIGFYFTWTIIYIAEFDQKILSYIAPAIRIADILNYGLLFRFIRVQVQLKAQKENSKKIMTAIERSNRI